MLIVKDRSIEMLRGIAIILMVMVHVIGSTGTGLDVPKNSLYHWFYEFTNLFRMPLFTIISGYIYALRPLQKEKVQQFLKGKVNRLIWPLYTVSIIQFIVRSQIPSANVQDELKNVWEILFFSYAQFWFLQAIILVFIAITFLEYFEKLKTIKSASVVVVISLILLSLTPTNWLFFSYSGFAYLLPCFLVGLMLKRFENQLVLNQHRVKLGIAALLVVIFQQLLFFNIIEYTVMRETALGVVLGCIVNLFLFSIRTEIK